MIIKTDREEFRTYLEDTSNLSGWADTLLIPEDKGEIVEFLRDEWDKTTPITIVAGRTGTTGGCIAQGGYIISMEKLDRIIDIDETGMRVKVQAGVPLKVLEEELNKYSLSLKAQPTEPLALVGGAVSTCASGPRGYRYGSIRGYVTGLEIILTGGDILRLRRADISADGRRFRFTAGGKDYDFYLPTYVMPPVKSSAGYFVGDNMDLVDLFIGQEGTLGIVTEVELCVQRLPEGYIDFVAFFGKEDDALSFVNYIKHIERDKSVCCIEFFDENSLVFLRPDFPAIPPAKAAVYIEIELQQAEDKNVVLELWAERMERYNCNPGNIWLGDNPKEQELIRSFRHRLPQRINEFLRQAGQKKKATDIAVPADAFPEMYNYYKQVGIEAGVRFVNFGHIGEDHLHFNFLPENERESRKAGEGIVRLVKKAISLGGTISAEHGVGKIKRKFLEMMFGRRHLIEMAQLKRVFDPYCRLNLGNIFQYRNLKAWK